MEIINHSDFFKITENFSYKPFNQSIGWYRMHSYYHPERIIFLINDLQKPTIACFAHEKRMFGIKMLLIEGECYKNKEALNTTAIRDFYKSVTELGYNIIEICSNALYDFGYETALRQAGYLRPVGQFSLPSTKIIRLDEPIKLNRAWKRNLKKASACNLNLEQINHVGDNESDDFIRIYSEMTTRKSLHQPFNKEQIRELCSDKEIQLFFVTQSDKRIAGLILYVNTNFAIPIYAASNLQARETSASYYMYDELFKHLIRRGIFVFDLAKLLPSTEGVNNVFNFKNGIQGSHIQLNGEWSWYNHTVYRPLMYFVKKYLMKKKEL
ncbi:MAG: hypothetical protein H6Q18_945 [Bacteroidetes bacterium]|nr:hypothetical protein [Bacteroidota bacterium]